MDSAEKVDMENIDESEGEEEDDSDVELSNSEDEDDEPKLKYQRLGSSVGEILKRDQASCMAVHSKFLALGTIFGAVYILDFNGNEIRRFPCHNQVIHEISIDESGEYVASCAEDGKVCINGLYASESMEFSYPKPVTALALDPLFAKKNSKAFVFGGRGGTLLMSTKGFFGRKDNTIHSGEGPISAIKWRGSLIAWANDQGVKIYDTEKNTRITHIEKPKGNPKPDLFRCHLCWESDNTLLIGWNDSVRIGLVRERFETPHGPSAIPSSILPDRYVEISAMFQTDFSICGIAPFGDYLVVLAYVEEEDNSPAMPELRILTRTKDEISSDSLTINGYKGCKPNQFRLCHIPEESLFYVIAPADIIVARPRDLDDHIGWLMEKQKYEEAMIAAEHSEVQLRGHNLAEIGQKYLEHLLENSQINKAAEMCPKILKRDAKLWEKWIYKFAELHQLQAICDYIPVGNPTLIETVYEMVLGFYMSSPETRYHDKFHNLVIEWPSDIYNIKNVITALKRIISTSTNENAILKQALAKLYTYDRQYDKALGIYLELKKGPVFELIRDFNLFDAVKDKVLSLVNFDKEKAVQLLVTNPDRILPETAVEQLQADQRLLHEYLHNLFLKDPQDAHTGKLFHEIQVKLYAEFDRSLLLPFLRQSNYYPLAKALQVCEDKHLYPEMVFLMGRMGNNKQGLQLLIEKIGDVKQAIEFIETQNDEELWDDLIDYSMKHPKFVSDLLEHIGAYVDPVKLIKKIPGGMEIVGLREKLVKIISDYNLQMSLREGCKEILKADCVDLMQRLSRGQRKAVRVEEEMRCAICSTPVLGSRSGTGLIVFFCHHAFHSKCLRQDSEEGGQNATGVNSPKQAPAVDSSKKNPKEEDSKFCPICMNQAKKTKTGAAVPTKTGRKLGAVGSAKVEGI